MATTGFIKKIRTQVPPSGAAVDTTVPIGTVDNDCTITGVTYIPTGTITGANTNTRTVSVINKGQAGTGTTSIASKALTSGNNMTNYDESALTLTSTAADLDCTAGDVLAFASIHAASGLADPGGVVEVTYSPKSA